MSKQRLRLIGQFAVPRKQHASLDYDHKRPYDIFFIHDYTMKFENLEIVTDSGWRMEIDTPQHLVAVLQNIIGNYGELCTRWYREYGWSRIKEVVDEEEE